MSKKRSEEAVGNSVVVHTPVLHEGRSVFSHFLVSDGLISRVTDEALTGLEGDEPSDSPGSTLADWLGRFATDELSKFGLGDRNWSSNHQAVVTGIDKLASDRPLPFLLPGASKLGNLVIISSAIAPETIRIERSFTPRAIAFLVEHGIVAEPL